MLEDCAGKKGLTCGAGALAPEFWLADELPGAGVTDGPSWAVTEGAGAFAPALIWFREPMEAASSPAVNLSFQAPVPALA